MNEERAQWPEVGAQDEADKNDVEAHQLGGDRDQLSGDDANAVLGEDGDAE